MCAYPDPIFDPPRIYVLEELYDNPDAAKRADRICTSFPNAEVRRFTFADFPEIVKEEGWGVRPQMGRLDKVPPPIPVLNLHRFDSDFIAAETKKMEDAYDGPGDFPFDRIVAGWPFVLVEGRGSHAFQMHPGRICRAGWRTHVGFGCPHQCAYCPYGYVMSSALNIEDFIEHLAQLIKHNPWQTGYLIDDAMDMLAMEPQWDLLPPLMRFFEKQDGRYMILHTKSDRGQALVDAGAPKNTIIAWSLSAATQSRKIEPNSGTTEGRIAAARACQEAGMTIRFKFKPIAPVKNWREEATEMIDRVFAETRPDNLSLTTIMWNQIEELEKSIPPDWLDPELLAMARDSREAMRKESVAPFPDDAREIIYRHYLSEIRKHDKNVPVALCTENAEMWKRMGGDLGFSPTNYVCGCGLTSKPGLMRLDENPWQAARASCEWDGTPVVAEQ